MSVHYSHWIKITRITQETYYARVNAFDDDDRTKEGAVAIADGTALQENEALASYEVEEIHDQALIDLLEAE